MVPMNNATNTWFDQELTGCTLVDARRHKRLHTVLSQIGGALGQSIPLACQDWANTKAAYRFFANDRVDAADILAGHFQSTCDRVANTDGPILVLHDTTAFTYKREKPAAIGIPHASTADAIRQVACDRTRFAASSCMPAWRSPRTGCHWG